MYLYVWKLDAKLQKESAICKCLAIFFFMKPLGLFCNNNLCRGIANVSPPFYLRCKSALPSLFLRYCSIACPSLLHRCSIVSMDNRWIIDGLLMDYLRRKSIDTIAR